MTPRTLSYLACLALFFVVGTNANAQAESEPVFSAAQLDYFETHVRPNLIKYCYECHSEESGASRGGLLLDTRTGMLEGGSSGALFDADNWEHSLFVDAITWADSDYEMPPKNKMPQNVIDLLKKWVEMGAPDPRVRKKVVVQSNIDIEAGKDHWAYQAPKNPPGATIDSLVKAKQSELGVEAAPPAAPLQLLRRLRFDLTGLPPTPDEARSFHRAATQRRTLGTPLARRRPLRRVLRHRERHLSLRVALPRLCD